MTDLTVFPADIAEMSVGQLANLPTQQLHEVDTNLDQAIAWLKSARTKVDAALEQRFAVRPYRGSDVPDLLQQEGAQVPLLLLEG